MQDPLCLCVSYIIRIFHDREGGIGKSVQIVTVLHHEACQMMTGTDFFYPTNNGLFFLLTIRYCILCFKKAPRSS